MSFASLIAPLALTANTWLLLGLCLFPLIGFGSTLALGSHRTRTATIVAMATMGLSFGVAVWMLFLALADVPLHWRFTWIDLAGDAWDGLPIRLTGGLRADALAALMCVLVTGIACLVQVFSISYMRGERYLNRYWGYLSLFTAAMLLIVLADNLLFIYIGWELVGVSSYLLIGFWYQREAPARASQQAFLVNRIGDLGFLIGMMILMVQCGTLDLDALHTLMDSWTLENGQWYVQILQTDGTSLTRSLDAGWLTALGIALFGGCIGKSAQFPLQIWLPDAMEGPTPVSSLIHAATMVTAGVYLMARVFFLLNEPALVYIAVTGSLTALMAALAAVAQWDIKRVLAYSTISQLGYMVMAIGVGAREMALLHLFTHAFFKCALFLCAGVIIHQLHHVLHGQEKEIDVQDMRHMGGLRRYLPQTFWLYLLPMLALAGLPLTSGFLSKDGILVAAWAWAGHYGGIAWLIPLSGLLTAGITAYYMARHAWLIWGGRDWRAENMGITSPPHEADLWMRIPLMILAFGSVWILFGPSPLDAEASWLMPSFATGEPAVMLNHPPPATHGRAHTWVPLLSVALALSGLAVGTWRYRRLREEEVSRVLATHFFQAQFYERVFTQPGLALSQGLAWIDKHLVDGLVNLIGGMVVHGQRGIPSLSSIAAAFDAKVIDGFVNAVVAGLGGVGQLIRKIQSGKAQQYMVLALLGILAIICGWWLF